MLISHLLVYFLSILQKQKHFYFCNASPSIGFHYFYQDLIYPYRMLEVYIHGSIKYFWLYINKKKNKSIKVVFQGTSL